MRSRADRARPSVRRVVLHGRVDHTDLLPPHLSGETRQVAQRRLLPHRGRRRARGFPPLLAVSTRDRTRDAGVAWCCGDSRTRPAAHRAWIPGRWQARRGSRRYAWDDGPTPAPTVRKARRCVADRRRHDPARSARETAGGRDHDADVLDRVHCGVRERPAIQRRVSRRVPTAANGRSQNKPWAGGRSERRRSVGSSRRSPGWPHQSSAIRLVIRTASSRYRGRRREGLAPYTRQRYNTRAWGAAPIWASSTSALVPATKCTPIAVIRCYLSPLARASLRQKRNSRSSPQAMSCIFPRKRSIGMEPRTTRRSPTSP